MLTLRKADSAAIVSLSTTGQSIEDLLSKEWLLTNGRGGYASSTVIGCNTSGYHALLVGSLDPPANRIMALANCLEMVIFNGESSAADKLHNPTAEDVFNLSTFEFTNKFAPRGFTGIRSFRRDTGVHFDYEFEKCRLTKSVYLARETDTVVLEYDFTQLSQTCEFIIRPFVGLRDFHALQKSYAALTAGGRDDGLIVHHRTPGSCELFLNCPGAAFEKDEQWWFNFVYRTNKERGQDFTEDLWTPGFFRTHLNSPTKVLFAANLSGGFKRGEFVDIDSDSIREELASQYRSVTSLARKGADRELATLCLAGDQFISKRRKQDDSNVTVLAGYPWFADWGRDAFIALPGLLLATGRFDEAKSVLTTFAAAADEGMIPNRFDDESNTAHFNSVDASLWFINAAFQYLDATGDSQTFTRHLLPTIRWIIDSYQKGTRFNIHADSDGLVTAGDSETQLTWMDAKYDGVAFTPRYGKPVEVNALWYNALCLLVQFYAERQTNNAERYKAMADQAGVSFRQLFWNDERRYLNDCVFPDGSVDSSLRPNQIFAVSLPFSPLTPNQQKAVVDAVHKNLLTPFGLRTLSPQDKRYKPAYTGTPQQRDEAYHQGTVWAFLIGPFIEAFLKINTFSNKSKKTAAEFIQPLLEHLTEDACLGSISEIFDGDAPHKPRGCIAQAWSVAEVLRAHRLINS
ncbi:MAG: glycogen debranching enzyme family protein [Phycisphaerae bacterium]|nr:glycogen debranching enzyme family protein [Phycisphaerae bacterium]